MLQIDKSETRRKYNVVTVVHIFRRMVRRLIFPKKYALRYRRVTSEITEGKHPLTVRSLYIFRGRTYNKFIRQNIC